MEFTVNRLCIKVKLQYFLSPISSFTVEFYTYPSSFFRCLVKNPLERASASELLNMEFIKRAKPSETLRDMIAEAQSIKEELQSRKLSVGYIFLLSVF